MPRHAWIFLVYKKKSLFHFLMNELPHHSLSLAGLGRFKAFAGHEDFDIKPITLLYGYNSSGKSSFLHSLLFLDQFRRDGHANVFKTHLGEESVDLGGFEHFIHRKDGLRELPCTFSVGFEETETEASGEYAASDSGLASLVVDPILKLTVGRAPDLIPYLETLEFVSSGDWVVRLFFEPLKRVKLTCPTRPRSIPLMSSGSI